MLKVSEREAEAYALRIPTENLAGHGIHRKMACFQKARNGKVRSWSYPKDQNLFPEDLG
jgi:hypothetical protein